MIARPLVVGMGGFLGAAARYLLGGAIYRWLPATFPWATLVINVTGCFGIGLVVALAEERMVLGPTSRLFLTIGVLGSGFFGAGMRSVMDREHNILQNGFVFA